MGMHHGESIARGDDLVGQTVNVAARISALAGPGELLVSQELLTACGSHAQASLRPVGPVLVKGVAAAGLAAPVRHVLKAGGADEHGCDSSDLEGDSWPDTTVGATFPPR